MLQTRVQNKTATANYKGHMTNVIESTRAGGVDMPEIDTPQILTKVMFIGLTVISVALFYLAISSLML